MQFVSQTPITQHELYLLGKNPTEDTRLMMAKVCPLPVLSPK